MLCRRWRGAEVCCVNGAHVQRDVDLGQLDGVDSERFVRRRRGDGGREVAQVGIRDDDAAGVVVEVDVVRQHAQQRQHARADKSRVDGVDLLAQVVERALIVRLPDEALDGPLAPILAACRDEVVDGLLEAVDGFTDSARRSRTRAAVRRLGRRLDHARHLERAVARTAVGRSHLARAANGRQALTQQREGDADDR